MRISFDFRCKQNQILKHSVINQKVFSEFDAKLNSIQLQLLVSCIPMIFQLLSPGNTRKLSVSENEESSPKAAESRFFKQNSVEIIPRSVLNIK
jgi:hypothetical protein